MGSCLLAMLMKGDDVYLMNVGDSRAVLAQKVDLERISEETLSDLDRIDVDEFGSFTSLASSQLTVDHSTSVEEVTFYFLCSISPLQFSLAFSIV